MISLLYHIGVCFVYFIMFYIQVRGCCVSFIDRDTVEFLLQTMKINLLVSLKLRIQWLLIQLDLMKLNGTHNNIKEVYIYNYSSIWSWKLHLIESLSRMLWVSGSHRGESEERQFYTSCDEWRRSDKVTCHRNFAELCIFERGADGGGDLETLTWRVGRKKKGTSIVTRHIDCW